MIDVTKTTASSADKARIERLRRLYLSRYMQTQDGKEMLAGFKRFCSTGEAMMCLVSRAIETGIPLRSIDP